MGRVAFLSDWSDSMLKLRAQYHSKILLRMNERKYKMTRSLSSHGYLKWTGGMSLFQWKRTQSPRLAAQLSLNK
jgi:hypothetical protein